MAPRQAPVYRHICIFINKAFCSFLLACLALTLGSPAAPWSLEPVQGWSRWVYSLPSSCGHRREYGEESRELPVFRPAFSWVRRKAHLTSEPALIIFRVEMVPPALRPPSVAGRTRWGKGRELASKAKVAPRAALVTCCAAPAAQGCWLPSPVPEPGPWDWDAQCHGASTLGDVPVKSLTHSDDEPVLACHQEKQRAEGAGSCAPLRESMQVSREGRLR